MTSKFKYRKSRIEIFFGKFFVSVKENFRYYILYGADKIRYLSSIGVKIGADCEILNAVNDFGSEPWLIELGNGVTLTKGVTLITHDASSRIFRKDLSGSSKYGNRFGLIKILDNCFIGINTIILPGVEIGPNSIIGAGSVVTTNVPPNTVVAGTPAKYICTLDEFIEKYKNRMVEISANSRDELRSELTSKLWGEKR